jgi:hypothetical protein
MRCIAAGRPPLGAPAVGAAAVRAAAQPPQRGLPRPFWGHQGWRLCVPCRRSSRARRPKLARRGGGPPPAPHLRRGFPERAFLTTADTQASNTQSKRRSNPADDRAPRGRNGRAKGFSGCGGLQKALYGAWRRPRRRGRARVEPRRAQGPAPGRALRPGRRGRGGAGAQQAGAAAGRHAARRARRKNRRRAARAFAARRQGAGARAPAPMPLPRMPPRPRQAAAVARALERAWAPSRARACLAELRARGLQPASVFGGWRRERFVRALAQAGEPPPAQRVPRLAQPRSHPLRPVPLDWPHWMRP